MSKYSLEYLRDHSRVSVNRSIPWTARVLGISDVETAIADRTSDGSQWLFDGPVPMASARDLLDTYRAESHPLAFLRPAMPWDDPSNMVTFDGQAYTVVTDESRQVITDAKSDRVHFVPKEGYQLHDHAEYLLDRTSRIIGSGLVLSSIVVLAHGAEAVIGISTGDLEVTPEGVAHYSVVLAAGSYNGTLSTTLCGASIMPVCDNTRDLGLMQGSRNGTMTKAKHTRYSVERLAKNEDEAAQALGILETRTNEFSEWVAEQCRIEMTDKQTQTWIESLSGLSALTDDSTGNARTRAERAAETLSALRSDSRVSPWDGTAFGALQLASTFDQWERSTRGGTDPYARIVRETVTGATGERESTRQDALAQILATV